MKAFLYSFIECQPEETCKKRESHKHQTSKNVSCDNLDGPRGHYARWDKSDKDKDKYCMISLTYGI